MAPADPLHVCCYIDSDTLGGMEASLSTLVTHLPPRVTVTVLGTDAGVAGSIAAARPGTAVRVVAPVRSKLDLPAIAAHVGAVRSLRPGVLHASLGQLWKGQYGLLAGVLSGTPTLGVVHSVLPPSGRFQVAAFRRLARHVDAYAGVSRAVCAEAAEALGLAPGRVRLLYNGVPAPARRDSRPPGGVTRPGRGVVGAIGRLREEKGYDDLLRAAAAVPGASVVIVGEGEERRRLGALAAELGVAGRLSMPGWRDDPWAGSPPFDVLAVPSRVEGFGLVAVEAMLRGIPVVAYRVGGLPEVVEDGVTGVLVEPGDVDGFAGALRALLEDPARRAAMGGAGRAAADRRFSVAAMVDAYVAVLEELAAGRPAGRSARRTMRAKPSSVRRS